MADLKKNYWDSPNKSGGTIANKVVATNPYLGNKISNISSGVASNIANALNSQKNAALYNGTSTVSSVNPYSGYADQIKSLYDQQQQKLNEYQKAQNAAAQNAYSKNLAALQSEYNSKIANLDSSLQNAKSQLAGYYDASKQSIDSDAAKAMQEAYVNRMLQQKNLQQQLTANGLSGGASESAIAGLINNYGNARNEIDKTRNTNLANLEQSYNQNLADVLENYYNAKSAADENRLNYLMQLENTLANNSTSSYNNLYNAMSNLDSSYLNAMQNALANQASYTAKSNTSSNVNPLLLALENAKANKTETEGTNMTSKTKKKSGYNSVDDMIMDLHNQGKSVEEIQQYFASMN